MARKRVPRSFQNGEYAGEDGAAAAGHNSESAIIKDPAERAALIESTVREVALLESERKELGERIRALKSANIKGRLGLKIGDFNAAFRVFNLEDDGRNAFLKTLLNGRLVKYEPGQKGVGLSLRVAERTRHTAMVSRLDHA